MAEKLRNEEKCNFIIALTHMRLQHDLKFAAEVPGVDFVLGGHDHFYKMEAVTQNIKKPEWKSTESEEKIVPVVKSGTDFLEFSEINISFDMDSSNFMKIADELVKDDGYTSISPKIHIKKEEDQDNSLLMHSEEN